jgi:predicted lipoprotein
MWKKTLKYGVLMAVIGLVGFNSVHFEKLSTRKATAGPGATGKFDAASYAQNFWTDKLLPATAQAPDLSTLLTELKANPQAAFAKSHALGIGNIRYFLVRGAGTVASVDKNDVTVRLADGTNVQLATEYVFGNAARDASGLIRNQDFDNTADLNALAEQLNGLIRARVVPRLRADAKPGSAVQFAGALELNQAHLHLNKLEVMPLAVTISPAVKP